MASTTLALSFGGLVPPTDYSKRPSSSLLQFPLSPPTLVLDSLSINPSSHGRSPNAAAAATSSSPAPSSSALDSRTASATSGSSAGAQPKSRGLRKRISARFEIPDKLKERIPDIGLFFATMTGLPVIREAIEGVQAMQDVTTSRQKLMEFGQRLEKLLDIIDDNKDDPRYLNPTFLEFEGHLETMYAQVERETQRHSGSRLHSASRLLQLIDDYEKKLVALVEDAMVTGVFAQQNVPLQEVYDSTIPTLKSIHKGNGLICKETISISRSDGSEPEEAPVSDLHISIIRGEYNGVPVEIKEFFGGSDDKLTETVKELVDHYQTTGLNPNLSELYGGSFSRSPTGQLRAHLVFSPIEGEPWLVVARTKQSVELLCQVAEQTSQAFQYLKLQKQMNWESIRIRPDGTLLLVPSTEGDNFLLEEQVLDPFDVPEDTIGWPLRELCELLHSASQQGIVKAAVEALREHDGAWNKIAVWRIAWGLGLRVPEEKMMFQAYPKKCWQADPGLIMRWAPVNTTEEARNQCFEPVIRMPPAGLSEHEREHLKSFELKIGHANGPDDSITYMQLHGEHWFTPTDDGLWECVALEPWKDVTLIQLFYESPRLEHVSWNEWKRILESAAKKKKLKLDELGVVIRTEGMISISKENVPELGTKPIYFYRKPDRKASPREFWGFFTFNKDPTGPTGLTVRLTEPHQYARIFSDNATPEMLERSQEAIELDFTVAFVNMRWDWPKLIKQERARLQRMEMETDSESEVEWPEEEMEN